MTRDEVFVAISAERAKQEGLREDARFKGVDDTNTPNDWVAYICAYAGRAATKCFRNEREGVDRKDMLIKTAALCVAALEAEE
jgi:hypothetical protein